MAEKTSFPGQSGPGNAVTATYGLWMLLGGTAGSAWLAWQGDGPIIALPAYVAVLGALLLLEARLLRRAARPPAAEEGPPGMILTASEGPAGPAGSGAVRRYWRLPIWLHLVFQALVTVPAFFGGAIAGACTAMAVLGCVASAFRPAEGQPPAPGGWGSALGGCCAFLVGAPLFFGGAMVSGGQAGRLFLEYVPARCPACGEDTRCQLGRPISYHCRSCGHVHATKVSVR